MLRSSSATRLSAATAAGAAESSSSAFAASSSSTSERKSFSASKSTSMLKKEVVEARQIEDSSLVALGRQSMQQNGHDVAVLAAESGATAVVDAGASRRSRFDTYAAEKKMSSAELK